MGFMDMPLELFPWGRYGSIMYNNLPKFLLVMRKILRNLASLMRLDSERIRRGWKRYSLGCSPRAETCGRSITAFYMSLDLRKLSLNGGYATMCVCVCLIKYKVGTSDLVWIGMI